MMQRILVPLDGSPVAEHGLTSARRVARETGAALSLVRAAPPTRGMPDLRVDSKLREADHAALQEAREYLSRVQDRLTQEHFAVHSEIVRGDPATAILSAADREAVDLISIGTHGSGLRHALVGSVAEAVIRQAGRPLLLTGILAALPDEPLALSRKILVSLDGTRDAEAALSYLARVHIGEDAELILLEAVPRVTPTYGPFALGDVLVQLNDEADRDTRQHFHDAEAYLHATGTAMHRQGAWRTRVTVGAAAAGIIAVAEAEEVDLIVLAAHGRQGLDRLMHASVALEVANQVKTPVLVLPHDWASVPRAAPH